MRGHTRPSRAGRLLGDVDGNRREVGIGGIERSHGVEECVLTLLDANLGGYRPARAARGGLHVLNHVGRIEASVGGYMFISARCKLGGDDSWW